MKVISEIKCPGCEFKTRVAFSKPTSLRNSLVNFKCETCGSSVSAQVKKGVGKIVHFKCQVVTPSDLLVEMKKEELEHHASGPYPEESVGAQS